MEDNAAKLKSALEKAKAEYEAADAALKSKNNDLGKITYQDLNNKAVKKQALEKAQKEFDKFHTPILEKAKKRGGANKESTTSPLTRLNQ